MYPGCDCNKKKSGEAAFSLVEILIVMVMGSLLISLVGPASVALYDRYSFRLAVNQLQGLEQQASWEAFIRRRNCRIHLDQTSETAGIILTCNQKQLAHQNLVEGMEANELFASLPLCFNQMGINVPCNNPEPNGEK